MNRTIAKKILLGPLDWGLGHTTRCIPLAQHLQQLGATVFFAGTAAQIAFFRKSVPDIQPLLLEGYGVTYAQTRRGFLPHLLKQLPHIFRCIRREHLWLDQMVQHYGFDGILSDNRYGLWHSRIPSVFITHQPGLQTGLGNGTNHLFAQFHQRLMRRFGAVWLVDRSESTGLSGALAHPSVLPEQARYIGLLSQFAAPDSTPSRKAGILILLSGPEPQRTLLSNRLWQQVQGFHQQVIFVEGRADAPERRAAGSVWWFAQLNAAELMPFMQSAAYVVCRSGYSTLMDAAVLGLSLVLIPTPGQTEQEYLGRELFRNGQALCYRQESFDLQKALEAAATFPFRPLGIPEDAHAFKAPLDAWYRQL
ncbi:MAG: glycosyl transferase family 28 [Sphingobacteriales bacterium]|nr:MAG: glycosyl transferase family 28 [Sphingobacteriales bacterium]